MYRIAILCLVLLAGATSCARKCYEDAVVVHEAATDISEIILVYSDELKREMNVHLHHSYACHTDNGYRISADFHSQEILDVDQARRLTVHLTEGLLDRLNSGESQATAANQYFFTANDLTINIEFESFYTRYVDILYVARAELFGGNVHIYAGTAFDWQSTIYHRHSEPYESSKLFTEVEDAIARGKEPLPLPTGSKEDGFYYPSNKRRYK